MNLTQELAIPEHLDLSKGEVQVWQINLDSLILPEEKAELWLSKDEVDRAERFRFERDRRHFIVGRRLLRLLLSAYLDVNPSDITLSYSYYGKPSLAAGMSRLSFNLSHSHGVALLAFVHESQVGVDIERIRRDFEVSEIAKCFFSAAEQHALSSLPAPLRHEAFFNCWTRKEAFVKAKGEGLSLPLDQFDVSLCPGQAAELLATRPNPEERHRWWLTDLNTNQGYAAALVVDRADLRVVRCTALS